MKTHPHLSRVGLFAAFSLLLSPFSHVARSASSSTPSPSAVSSLTVSGTNTFLSGSTVNFAAGSTVSVSGIFGGTPSGGTLNLSNLTLTLGTPIITGALALPTTTTLGPSGPSVASSIASRAQAQGIAVDGGTSRTVGFTSSTVFGLSAFTLSANLRVDSLSSPVGLFGGSASSCALVVNTNGTLKAYTALGAGRTASTGVLTAGKMHHVAYVRDAAGSGTYYIDGIAAGTTDDAVNYTGVQNDVLMSDYGSLLGVISDFAPFNYAKTQPQIVALCERGVSASDIPATPAGTERVVDGNFSSATNWILGIAWSIGSGVATCNGTADGGISTEMRQTGGNWKAGERVRVTFTLANVSSGGFAIGFGSGAGSGKGTVRTASGTYVEEIILTADAAYITTSLATTSLNNGATLDNLSAISCGALACYSDTQPGIGYQYHDVSGNKADLTLPASGATFARLAAVGPAQVRATLTWAGSHEAKSLLGQVALPPNAVITSIITTASAADPGGGMTVGSVTTPNLFVNAVAYTTAKKVHTLATQLPAGIATNDLNLVVDPGTSNYTGTIQIAVNYVLAQ